MSAPTLQFSDAALLPVGRAAGPGEQEEPALSPPAQAGGRWIALRTPPGGGAGIALNMAATLGQWAQSAGEEFSVGVLLPPFSAETGRYLYTYGPSMDAVLHDHLGLPPAESYSWEGENCGRSRVREFEEALRRHLSTPGGLRDCVQVLTESADDTLAGLVAGERPGLTVIPGVCTSWPESLSPATKKALGQAMHDRVSRYLHEHCDLVLLPTRGRRDPAWVGERACDLEIVVEESTPEGAARAALHPEATLALLHGREGHRARVHPDEISTRKFAELCGRTPDAETTLNIYELMGGRGGGLLVGHAREASSREAFMELTRALLLPLLPLPFLASPLPPPPPSRWAAEPRPSRLGRMRAALRRAGGGS